MQAWQSAFKDMTGAGSGQREHMAASAATQQRQRAEARLAAREQMPRRGKPGYYTTAFSSTTLSRASAWIWFDTVSGAVCPIS